jgi:hypothetical protein
MLEFSKLKRNGKLIVSKLKEKGDEIYATEKLSVVFPTRYINRHLCLIGNKVSLISVFLIADDKGNYGIMNIPAMIDLTPNEIMDIKVDGADYKELIFEKDSLFTDNNNLMKRADFMYDMFDEFLINGKVPFFLNYDDLSNLFRYTAKYANTGLGNNPLAMEITTSIIARSKKDVNVKYREYLSNPKGKVEQPNFIGLMDIYNTFDSNINKMAGSYAKAGISSAVTNKQQTTSSIEEVLLQ